MNEYALGYIVYELENGSKAQAGRNVRRKLFRSISSISVEKSPVNSDGELNCKLRISTTIVLLQSFLSQQGWAVGGQAEEANGKYNILFLQEPLRICLLT